MDEKQRLINSLDRSRAAMRAELADLRPDTEIYPGWTKRHFIAHLTGWDDAVTSSLRAHAGGREPATPAVEGIDVYNASSVATREMLDYDHVVREWEQAREQLKAAIDALPPEKLLEPLLFPWGQIGSVARLIRVIEHHEGTEHIEELRQYKTNLARAQT
jgi:hypothetical protein